MPGSFRNLIQRNSQHLERGAETLLRKEFLLDSGRQELESEILNRSETIVGQLRSKPRFSEVTLQLGMLSQMILFMNLPCSTDENARKLTSFLEVIRASGPDFRVVAYEGEEIGRGPLAVTGFLNAVQIRSSFISERFQFVSSELLESKSRAKLDPKSTLYGVGALVYSRSVNDVARIWLWIWRSANGDMSGYPGLIQLQADFRQQLE